MDINRASAEELQRAFEVDGERARYIIDRRNQLGGFESWEQIKEVVPSIDNKMAANLRAAGITIGARTGSRSEADTGAQHRSSESSSREQHRSASQTHQAKSVNSVSREELEQVCQIDGERADYFLQKRGELGGFQSWEQIKDEVSSFDGGMIKRLKKAGFSVGKSDTEAA